MASLALPADLFAIVTTSDRSQKSPLWKSLLDWPRSGDSHIDYAADTLARRNIWAARLDQAVLRSEKPVLLVASGESCLATAWWARLSPASYVSKVAGALLFAPTPGDEADSRFASPRAALPFPSAVIDHASHDRIEALAQGWGSAFEKDWEGPAEARAWHQAQAMLMRMTASLVERRMRAADALGIPG
ncbi:alpha/beta hydrolase [Sphingomonas sp. LB-2]|uniref:alpha/beta hydrolase n=1 Tax=Sphingomonas caeni TaxID=2984949 RepID=UPI00222F896E|nr:alpha/beta hydrolase [Sphingomonas caeni]MCW3847892.1 alpha/beta hydrolase [Sphingomonas caeni]